ncbi:hypothetical protein, partial [Corynebacterium pyruviciproducens]|uniref:hypothetical protein n=1 Tax=Corynebacterium pyruviciproducens TaxID=598660 RepID=UPI0023F0EC35
HKWNVPFRLLRWFSPYSSTPNKRFTRAERREVGLGLRVAPATVAGGKENQGACCFTTIRVPFLERGTFSATAYPSLE